MGTMIERIGAGGCLAESGFRFPKMGLLHEPQSFHLTSAGDRRLRP